MSSDRPAARVVCVDGRGRVLLMHWRDTVSGVTFWEPPGGGLDPGETPLDAARRELTEETSLPGDAVLDTWVPVPRDYHWLGVHYSKVEPFYLALFPTTTPEVAPSLLTTEESETYLGSAWHSPADFATLPDQVDPPELPEIIAKLLQLAES
ncbi:NUDIX hydrolase [Sphaerisporangium aureirubrum]|uniref:NUDIX hydrolase n=1 Tax=Sphaerisporangium aureirubrum TaxID=1544736 RepID=A0ABW1NPL7_9ACTN